MEKKKVKTRVLMVRKAPFETEELEETIEKLVKGDQVSVVDSTVVYDWKGKSYLHVKTASGKDGYVREEAIE